MLSIIIKCDILADVQSSVDQPGTSSTIQGIKPSHLIRTKLDLMDKTHGYSYNLIGITERDPDMPPLVPNETFLVVSDSSDEEWSENGKTHCVYEEKHAYKCHYSGPPPVQEVNIIVDVKQSSNEGAEGTNVSDAVAEPAKMSPKKPSPVKGNDIHY